MEKNNEVMFKSCTGQMVDISEHQKTLENKKHGNNYFGIITEVYLQHSMEYKTKVTVLNKGN